MTPIVKLLGPPIAAGAVMVAQVLHAAHRTDLPSLENHDPSGRFGDASLPPLRILALGDSSITAPGVHLIDQSWIRRVANHLAERFCVDLESIAVGGSRAADVIRDQLPLALDADADLAILSVGGNDALRATSLHQFREALDHMVSALHESSGAVLVSGLGDLGTMTRLPRTARLFASRRARSYDRAIEGVVGAYKRASKTTAWHAAWKALEDEPERYFAQDRFHFSEHGHGLFAQMAIPTIDALVAAHLSDESTDFKDESRGSSESSM